MKLLLENGADIDAKDFEGKTPLEATNNQEAKDFLIAWQERNSIEQLVAEPEKTHEKKARRQKI